MDKKNRILFSACSNNLMVILNAESGAVITTVPIGSHVDGAAFDNVKKCAYSSNGEGSLTVVKEEGENKFTADNFKTQPGARTIAVNLKTHHIYLPTAEFEPPPEPTTDNPHPRPKIKPGTFVILDVEPLK
jgi:DNA-binding beta-propeller fold protein YncE